MKSIIDNLKNIILSGDPDLDSTVDQINGIIHYLTYHDRLDIIKMIDNIEDIITQKNLEGDTVYHIAAKLNNLELLEYFIELNENGLYISNKSNYKPLYYLLPNHEFICNLFQTFQLKDHMVCDDYGVLQYYMQDEDKSTFDNILEEIDEPLSDNLFYVIDLDIDDEMKINFIKSLIDNDVDVNYKNNKFITPLIQACYHNDTNVIKLLVDENADCDYSGPEGLENPITICILNKNEKAIKKLMKCDVNMTDKNLRTPLHYLFQNGSDISLGIKKRMLDKCRDVNVADIDMNTVLNLIVQYDNWNDYSDILVNKKLNIYKKNRDGICPADIVDERFYDIVLESYLNQLKTGALMDSCQNHTEWQDDFDKNLSNRNVTDLDKNELMKRIKNGVCYPKRTKHHIKILIPPSTNITHFSSYSYNYICYLYYLLNKYLQIKIPITPELNMTLKEIYQTITEDFRTDDPADVIIRSIIKDYVCHSQKIFNHVIIWKSIDKIFVSPWLEDSIYETLNLYPDIELIIFKLTILNDMNQSHANMIIYDVDKNIIERFDPYGIVPYIDSESIDAYLSGLFTSIIPDVEYISPQLTSNGISFQVYSDENNSNNYVENDPNGFCVAWCLWYSEMRAMNSDVCPKNLIKFSVKDINNKEDKFKDYIRNYSNYLDKKKNIILNDSGMPKKYWYSHSIPDNYYHKYLRYSNNIFDKIL